MQPLDFRSDTVTRPSLDMREFMMRAEVGDDVYGEDPTVLALEHRLAEMFGQQAGLFCVSGTMSNQIAILAQTRPGDEVICSDLCHIYHYEGGGLAANAGVQVRLLSGEAARPGQFTTEQVHAAVRAADVHHARTRVVAVEDTSNRGGGSIWDAAQLDALAELSRARGLVYHLDGARVFNRLALTGESSQRYGARFTSISVCLSKGLGAPVGSVLLGEEAMIREARRVRKRLGGGMRQAGYLAAAGMYALDHHREGLAQDHALAHAISHTLASCTSWIAEVMTPQTNIVLARVHVTRGGSQAFVEACARHGVKLSSVDAQWVRMVTHRDVRCEGVEAFMLQTIACLEAMDR